MNEIRRIESETEEIARVRAILDRFAMPSFVAGYDVKLGEFEGEPSIWIRFQTTHRFPDSVEQGLCIGRELNTLGKDILRYLRVHYPERYPYFRYADAGPAETQRA